MSISDTYNLQRAWFNFKLAICNSHLRYSPPDELAIESEKSVMEPEQVQTTEKASYLDPRALAAWSPQKELTRKATGSSPRICVGASSQMFDRCSVAESVHQRVGFVADYEAWMIQQILQCRIRAAGLARALVLHKVQTG